MNIPARYHLQSDFFLVMSLPRDVSLVLAAAHEVPLAYITVEDLLYLLYTGVYKYFLKDDISPISPFQFLSHPFFLSIACLLLSHFYN